MGIDYLGALQGIAYMLFQLGLVFGVVALAKYVRVWITPFDDFTLIRRYALSASGLAMGGYLGALALFISLAFAGESAGFLNDIAQIVVTLLIGIALLSSNRIFVNGILLRGFAGYMKPSDEVAKNNLAVGIYQMAAFLAAGVQFSMANQGVTEITIGLFMITVPFFILGQTLLALGMFLFCIKTSYDDLKEIKSGNTAVSVSHGFLMVSLALLIGNVIAQADSLDLFNMNLIIFYSIFSILFLIYIPFFMARYFLTGSLKDGNNEQIGIERAVAEGNTDIAILYGMMRVIVALVILHAMPFGIFIV